MHYSEKAKNHIKLDIVETNECELQAYKNVSRIKIIIMKPMQEDIYILDHFVFKTYC